MSDGCDQKDLNTVPNSSVSLRCIWMRGKGRLNMWVEPWKSINSKPISKDNPINEGQITRNEHKNEDQPQTPLVCITRKSLSLPPVSWSVLQGCIMLSPLINTRISRTLLFIFTIANLRCPSGHSYESIFGQVVYHREAFLREVGCETHYYYHYYYCATININGLIN